MKEIFWRTVADYNGATWVAQLLFVVLGAVMTLVACLRPSKGASQAMKLYFAVLYLWISVAYFGIYCSERSYSGVMSVFWAVLAVVWLWDFLRGYTLPEPSRKHRALAVVLMLMPLAYPAISMARGMEFPQVVTPVMPCSVVVFTIGYMLMFSLKPNIFLLLLLCHWSLIGISKVSYYDLPEDYVLMTASVPALYCFFRERFLEGGKSAATKPSAGVLHLMLLLLCTLLAGGLLVSMVLGAGCEEF